MALKSIVGIVCTCLSVVSINTSAATYSITFYEKIALGWNLFDTDNYIVSGTGSFEINDADATPNNLVLFSEFLSFDANITARTGSAQFTLGTDDIFPLSEQGLLFDASGLPHRFDNPTTIEGNTAQMRSDEISGGLVSGLVLYDDDSFDLVILNDGSIVSRTTAISNGDAFTRLGGVWKFSPETTTHNLIANSFYLIQAVPIPAAIWLFGSGLIGLIGVARRK